MVTSGAVLEDRYHLRGVLGRGGMADVFRASDEQTGEPVAVKVLRGLEGVGAERFAAEATVLERLDHPAIVRLRSVGEDGGRPYLVLDLIEGTTLDEVLRAGPLDPDRAVAVTASVADALAHAHTLGIVHRDIKPANVLLDEAGNPHVLDFGIARFRGAATLTLDGEVVGTAHYLAPEQVAGGTVGPAADVYALGLLLLECLTGHRAFTGTLAESAAARTSRAPLIPSGVAAPHRSIIARMTALDPAERPSAAEVAGLLAAPAPDDATATMAVVDPTMVLTRPPAVHRLPRSLVAVLTVLILTVVAGLATAHSGSLPSAPPTTVAPTTTLAPATTTAPPPPPTVPPPAPDDGKDHHGKKKGKD